MCNKHYHGSITQKQENYKKQPHIPPKDEGINRVLELFRASQILLFDTFGVPVGDICHAFPLLSNTPLRRFLKVLIGNTEQVWYNTRIPYQSNTYYTKQPHKPLKRWGDLWGSWLAYRIANTKLKLPTHHSCDRTVYHTMQSMAGTEVILWK